MIVEDDVTTCSALRAILSRRGWDIAVATSLGEGLRILAQHPACVILDLMLPDGDGIVILQAIRAQKLNVRVVVTTGVHDGDRLDAVRKLNPVCVLQKPIDLPRLLAGLEDSSQIGG